MNGKINMALYSFLNNHFFKNGNFKFHKSRNLSTYSYYPDMEVDKLHWSKRKAICLRNSFFKDALIKHRASLNLNYSFIIEWHSSDNCNVNLINRLFLNYEKDWICFAIKERRAVGHSYYWHLYFFCEVPLSDLNGRFENAFGRVCDSSIIIEELQLTRRLKRRLFNLCLIRLDGAVYEKGGLLFSHSMYRFFNYDNLDLDVFVQCIKSCLTSHGYDDQFIDPVDLEMEIAFQRSHLISLSLSLDLESLEQLIEYIQERSRTDEKEYIKEKLRRCSYKYIEECGHVEKKLDTNFYNPHLSYLIYIKWLSGELLPTLKSCLSGIYASYVRLPAKWKKILPLFFAKEKEFFDDSKLRSTFLSILLPFLKHSKRSAHEVYGELSAILERRLNCKIKNKKFRFNVGFSLFTILSDVLANCWKVKRITNDDDSSNLLSINLVESHKTLIANSFNLNFVNEVKLVRVAKFPMIVPPKHWYVLNDSKLELGTSNFTGGPLLNGISINGFSEHLSAVKPSFSGHNSFMINSKVVNALNKLQDTSFRLDFESLDFISRHPYVSQDYIAPFQLKEMELELSTISKLIPWFIRELKILQKKLKSKETLGNVELDKTIDDYNKFYNSLGWRIKRRGEIIPRIDKAKLLDNQIENWKNIKDNKPDKIYFVYTTDSRGRIYSDCPGLSPINNKLARASLRFNERQPFSLFRFKIYAAGCSIKFIGKSDQDKIDYFDNNLHELFLYDSLEPPSKPLEDLLKNAEEGFGLLSCAYEYKRYWNEVGKYNNGQIYYSDFPIYLDVASSGPQIISVLLCLEEFAQSVNLVEQSDINLKSQDFYIDILRQYFAVKGIEYSKMNDFTIQLFRRLFKKGIMTQFYGVTPYTFRASVFKEYNNLKDSDRDSIKEIVGGGEIGMRKFIDGFYIFLRQGSLLVLDKIFKQAIFLLPSTGSKASLTWHTKDGCRICMHYLAGNTVVYEFRDKFGRCRLSVRELTDKTDLPKQRNAAMANFTHSCDAFLMREVVLSLRTKSIIPIHDCWGVHSCMAEELSAQIIEIYSELLENKNGYHFLINELADCIESSSGGNARKNFLNYVAELKVVGNLKPTDIRGSRHHVS